MSRRALQATIAVLGLVPILAGGAGVLSGPAFVGAPLGADSHFRYLSGLLLAIGLGFWSTIPRIERRTGRVRLLTAIVVCGGLGRLWSLVVVGPPDTPNLFALGMELAVTPLLAVWQARVAREVRGP